MRFNNARIFGIGFIDFTLKGKRYNGLITNTEGYQKINNHVSRKYRTYQVFILKNIDEARNYLIEEINQNELMSKKYKKVYRV